MLEYPEFFTIAKQMEKSLMGKTVTGGTIHRPNSNLFMGEGEGEKYALLAGGKITSVDFFAPELYLSLDNGYGLHFCQCGGKIIYHTDAAQMPDAHTIHFFFGDGSALSYTMKLWSLGIFARSHKEWEERKKETASRQFQPLGTHSFADYQQFLQQNDEQSKLPVKVFLTKFTAGIMGALAGEILLYAGVHPAKMLGKLSEDEHRRVYSAMGSVVSRACELGGRTSEVDLYGNAGGYRSMAERKHIGAPCPLCGTPLEKTSAGGVTAYCPACQRK